MVTHITTNLMAAHGQKLNSQPTDHKSDALTITIPSHHMPSKTHFVKTRRPQLITKLSLNF